MEDVNYNYWGELVVPVGLLICFGVALAVWLRQEWAAEPEYDFDEPAKESKKR